ncbi:MAG TPA: hypothetical protein VNT20_16485 [Flavisolibacter sp.]|jgi:hypothetical protein|nr:hypothetical protein [Flavisolibacter sp.]
MKKKFMPNVFRVVTIILLLLISINALLAGYSFIADPSGNGLGMTTDYLRASAPFKDYFIPGIVLFTVNGVLSVVVAFFVLRRLSHYAYLVWMQGCILIGWIAVQLTMVTSVHPLHYIITSTGIILVLMGTVLLRKNKATHKDEGDNPMLKFII